MGDEINVPALIPVDRNFFVLEKRLLKDGDISLHLMVKESDRLILFSPVATESTSKDEVALALMNALHFLSTEQGVATLVRNLSTFGSHLTMT